MKLHTLNRMAIAAAMVIGFAGAATASPTFTINPDVLAAPVTTYSNFDATLVNGTTSELLHMNAVNNTATATGWAQFSSFSNGANQLSASVTGLTVDYNLYLTFQLADTLVEGTFGAANSLYDLTLLNFQVWGDLGSNTTFQFANALTNTEAAITGGNAEDIFLAAGSLIDGVAGFDRLGGAFINAINSFAVCTGAGTADVGGTAIALPSCANGIGDSFFDSPTPFYSLAFSAFNNTTQGILRNADGSLISIQNAVGIVDFNRVPEPGTLVLAGLALLGAGLTRRMKKTA